MVDISTQREPIGAVAPLGSLRLYDGDVDWGLIHSIRMNPRPRSKHHPTLKGASGSGRTPEAT
eukprot:4421930-Pleurochrysis_carterae.AAC.1